MSRPLKRARSNDLGGRVAHPQSGWPIHARRFTSAWVGLHDCQHHHVSKRVPPLHKPSCIPIHRAKARDEWATRDLRFVNIPTYAAVESSPCQAACHAIKRTATTMPSTSPVTGSSLGCRTTAPAPSSKRPSKTSESAMTSSSSATSSCPPTFMPTHVHPRRSLMKLLARLIRVLVEAPIICTKRGSA
jgi:hypothetical protein